MPTGCILRHGCTSAVDRIMLNVISAWISFLHSSFIEERESSILFLGFDALETDRTGNISFHINCMNIAHSQETFYFAASVIFCNSPILSFAIFSTLYLVTIKSVEADSDPGNSA
jgi:hypothetical protein